MTVWESILFGIIQGITEIFPVSSSAHLGILGSLFGVNGDTYNFAMMTVFLHFGTLLSIIIVYLPELEDMVLDLLLLLRAGNGTAPSRKHYPSARLGLMLCVSCLPLILILPFYDRIDALYSSSYFVGGAIIITGIILFICDHLNDGEKDERNMVFSDALIIGLCQTVAAIPGISRIAVNMTACKASGLSREFSLKYAYLLSIPTVFGMNIVHLVWSASMGFLLSDVPKYLIGMVTAMLTGMVCMRFVRRAAEKNYFHRFSYYCWVAGVLFIILTMIF